MPSVTALRTAPRGRVAVELDGSPWRTLPIDVVARSGVTVGGELDRPALRLLRRELRRAEALAVAGRALQRRNLSRRELTERLGRNAAPRTAAEALETLDRAGLVDDRRVAAGRAAALAERGYGDLGIGHDLEQRGVARHEIEEAIGALCPELERAGEIVARRGPGQATARYLAGKGFGEEAVEAALEPGFANDP